MLRKIDVMPRRFTAVVGLFTPLLAFVVACGDVEVAHSPPPPIGTTGGTDATGGTGGSSTGATGGTIGVGGSANAGGSGDEGGTGATGNVDAVCGNDRLEPGELCDDGNTKNDDGCSADCSEADPDYLCTEGKGCVRVVTCGNGVIEGDEVCDDKNTKNGDGCSAACDALEDGFICAKPGQPCVEKPVCGNGVREQGEQCDDHNDADDDGCDSSCQLETGWFCPPGESCVPLACGDGNRTPDEQCEDGNTDDGDGCAADCTVETGFLCSSSGCKAICGDGLVLGAEKCDDDNAMSGDGCSSACKIEPYYDCDDAEPSHCQSNIVCGDGVLSPGEVCDPGIAGQTACYGPAQGASACKGYDTGVVDPPVCNNGVVEYMEECDGNVQGCTNCQVDDGFVCPAPNTCFRLPVCGDGFLQAGEECDLGLVSGPGCVGCLIQPNYFCSGEPSTCIASICGDKIRAPDEECDDGPGTAGNPGTPVSGDGCSSTCTVEPGYACPPGADCLAICGDGVRTGAEECDPTPANTTACLNCKLRPGYKCGANGQGPCVATACPNGAAITDPPNSPAYITKAKAAAEPGEGCDDGNTVAGDGCGPTCQLEPQVTVGPSPTVALTCGDGLKTGSEGCDDGNITNGDGCSSTCAVETGWQCSEQITYPGSVAFRVTYRDFKQRTETGGHPHMKSNGAGDTTTAAGSPGQGNDMGIVGAVCTVAQPDACGRLDSEGKPTYAGGTHTTIDTTGDGTGLDETYHKAAFKLWYRDTNVDAVNDPTSQADGNAGTNVPIQIAANPTPVPAGGDTLVLGRIGTTSAYQFSQSNNLFYPLGSASGPATTVRGFGYTPGSMTPQRNWQFTSELRYFFQYQGGETLTFFGDDDVWVFINGRLAVDIGGIHGQVNGRVVLGDDGADGTQTESNCSIHVSNNNTSATLTACPLQGAEATDGNDKRFGLVKGGVYEIVIFQAERHPTGSDYQLTLDGFIAPRSSCQTDCGDSIKAGTEMCDGGRNMPASGYGVCLNNCTIQFCGDKKVNGSEACDDGANSDVYGTSGCAPGCKLPAKCGDGILQANFNEECDKGNANQNGLYGGCSTSCKLGPYCGDGVQNGTETCDPPDHVFATYGQGKCNYNCKAAPYCGDGIRNGAEICDGDPNCNANCEYDPFCGDGLKSSNEACDNGMFNYNGPPESAPYGGCTNMCALGPYCGDSTLQKASGEECDDGSSNADNVYDGCTKSCTFGPHCGDAVVQDGAGEACDNGFNEDDYAYPGSANACGKNCKAVPYCGDGKLQSAFELCDDGADNDDAAYDGCTTRCEWGPYCGDGTKNGPEQCDDGADNKAYSPDGKGCSYECKKNLPYCGDGIRNGPEQCDDGKNDGSYGTCNADCTRAPYCGDGKVQKSFGEQCDEGPTGSLSCSPTCQRRAEVPK